MSTRRFEAVENQWVWPSREKAECTAALACTIAVRLTVALVPRPSAKDPTGSKIEWTRAECSEKE